MSDLLEAFQERHQQILNEMNFSGLDKPLLGDIQRLIDDLHQAGEVAVDPEERSHLRALLGFWARVVYEQTGTYAVTSLLPLDTSQSRIPREQARQAPPPLLWLLVGGASVATIALALVIIGLVSGSPIGGNRMPTPQPAPRVRHAEVGTSLGGDNNLASDADTFCLGVPQVIVDFELEGLQPATDLRWELWRDGQKVGAEPAVPYGEGNTHLTVQVGGDEPSGVEAGQYSLFLYADEQLIQVQPFEVLGITPRASSLQVTDVPEPGAEAAVRREFRAAARVIYLRLEYEGLCPGIALSCRLESEGQIVQQIAQIWQGESRGQTQVVFQASGDAPFAPGSYEAVVAIAGEEQGGIRFTITEQGPETSLGEGIPEPEHVPPAFGPIAIGLGVQADGSVILARLDSGFDPDTKAIYGVFDYVGMSYGLPWAAVWRRAGQEVAREESFWNEQRASADGTTWVAYYDEQGRALATGNYSVTLYIDNVEQRTASFSIR